LALKNYPARGRFSFAAVRQKICDDAVELGGFLELRKVTAFASLETSSTVCGGKHDEQVTSIALCRANEVLSEVVVRIGPGLFNH
jgi:hypothetical protein